MIYHAPNTENAIVNFKPRYENFIGGEWVKPLNGKYFKNTSPIDLSLICEIPQSDEKDITLAIKAATLAFASYSQMSVQARSELLLKIAERLEQNIEILAVAETWDNGKPIRETLNADIPLAVDHFRYFAGVIRAEEGAATEINPELLVIHIKEPIGVVGQIIPWNFPILMAVWKLAPALAAGCTVVLKPAEQTPASILILMELIQDILPKGVVNVVNGLGEEAGQALATADGIAKLAFTGSTAIGQHILKCAAERLIPSTIELGGKSPNVFFADIFEHEPEYLDKAIEGVVLGFFNQGEVCTCPSRVLVQESIAEKFIAKVIEKTKTIKHGNPLDTTTLIGAMASEEQFDRVTNYLNIAKNENMDILFGGNVIKLEGYNGYYIEPTIIKGTNDMRLFQEEIFGPVIVIATFKDEAEALKIANDTIYGLGSGVWTRDFNRIWRMAKGIQAGRVWVNCYHVYPAHVAFGGYKKSGIGRETHKMTLGAYSNVKAILISQDVKPTGLY